MKIKRNDTVTIIAGKDKGKTGKVLRAMPTDEKVVVEGANLLAKHLRPRKAGEKGQKIFIPAPLHIGKVMLLCPQCGKAARVGYRFTGTGADRKKERICKRCSAAITV